MNKLNKRPPKIAIAGCSWFALAAHLPALRKLSEEGIAEIVALCSRTQTSINEAQKIIGKSVSTYSSLEEMLAQQDIDVVDLILPTPIMESSIYKCFAFGKNVISEKPCASDVLASRRLISAHAQTNLFWSVAENWPFKPTVIAIGNILKGNSFGKITKVDFSNKNLGWGNEGIGWRASKEYRGGYLLDSGVHFVSMLRLLIGGVSEVNAEVGWHKTKFVADRVQAEIVYENGAIGEFVVDFTRWPAEDDLYNLIISCSNGYVKANFYNNIILWKVGDIEQAVQVGEDPWVEGGVYSMLKNCCESLSAGIDSFYTPMEAMKDVAVVEAMIESSRIGKSVLPNLLYKQIEGKAKPVSTYENLFNYKPQYFVSPTSTAEVSIAIREAKSLGVKIRPIGSGFNWTSYCTTQGLAIDLRKLNKKCNIDLHRKTIQVDAGMLLADVTNLLAKHNLCFPSLPFLGDATIGGVISTATHGTSPNWGTMSDIIVSLTLVAPNGAIFEISERSNNEMLRAARAAVGMLGVITEVELQAVDMKWVRNIRIDLTLEEFDKFQPIIFEKYEHVWGHWILDSERLVIQCLETSQIPLDGFVPYVTNNVGNWVHSYHHEKPFEKSTNTIMLSLQYGVPLKSLYSTLKLINESSFAKANSGREIELKFLKHDSSTLLGPNADWDAVLFNIFWPSDFVSDESIFNDFESTMRSICAKPHWGKYHTKPSLSYIKDSYAQWAEFNSIREKLDPDNSFFIFD